MKAIRFITVSRLAGCLFILCLASCLDKRQATLTPEQLLDTYKDSTILAIDGNLYDPHVIWGEVRTYLPAFHRIVRHSHLENNQIVIDVTSGAQIRISENIYQFVRKEFEHMNKVAREENKKIVPHPVTGGYTWESQQDTVPMSK